MADHKNLPTYKSYIMLWVIFLTQISVCWLHNIFSLLHFALRSTYFNWLHSTTWNEDEYSITHTFYNMYLICKYTSAYYGGGQFDKDSLSYVGVYQIIILSFFSKMLDHNSCKFLAACIQRFFMMTVLVVTAASRTHTAELLRRAFEQFTCFGCIIAR